MKNAFTSLAFGGLSVALLIGWLFYGSDGAHNVIVFLVWFDGFMGLVAFFACFATKPAMPKQRGRIHRTVNLIVNGAILALLIWFGQFLLVGITIFSLAGFFFYRTAAQLHADKAVGAS
jgi:hypothetical protein